MLQSWRVVGEFNGSIRRYLISWGFIAFAYFGIQAVALNLYFVRLGLSVEQIGLLQGSGQLLWALLALPAAAFGRRIGLRTALVSATGILATGMTLLLFVAFIPLPYQLQWIFVCWLLLWSGAAMQTVNGAPYLMQVASEHERNHAFSLQAGVMAGMGFAGAVVAGALPRMIAAVQGQSLATSPWPFWGVLWLAPLAYLSGVFVMWGASDVDGSIHDRQRGQTVPLRPLLLLAVVTFLGAASEGSVRALFNVYLDQALVVAPQIIGLVFGAAQLAALLIVLFAPTLLQRRDARGVYLLALGGLVVVYCLMSLFAVPVVAALAYVGFFCMVTLAGPARNLFGQQLVERRWRATAAAIVTIGVALGWASTAALGGYFAAQFGFSGLFSVSAGLAGLAALTLWGWRSA